MEISIDLHNSKYDILKIFIVTEKWNIGYNLGLSCFTFKKVYFTNAMFDEAGEMDELDILIERCKNLWPQNTLSIGFIF